MTTFRGKSVTTLLVLLFLAASVAAKRMAPKPVSPVVSDGLRYSAAGDGRDQYVVAADVSSGKELWKVKVFHNDIDPLLEEDVQWVFITNLKRVDYALVVKDEKSRCYSLDLRTKSVKKQFCGRIF
jgi:hypothetical protein